MRRRPLRWLALAVVLGVAGCNPGACAQNMVEEAIEAETGGEVDIDADAGTVTLRGDDGEVLTITSDEDGIELPSDFPENIPVYPGAQATQYASMGDTVQAGFNVADAITTVRDWYVEQLGDAGWTIQMNAIVPDGGLMVAELDGEALSLTMTAEDGATMLLIILGRK